MATRDIAPGEALITVPLSLALVERDPPPFRPPPPAPSPPSSLKRDPRATEEGFLSRAPWPVRMGLELLERRSEARKRAEESERESALLFGGEDGADGGIGDGVDGAADGSGIGRDLPSLGEAAWFDLLPASIPLPTTTFTASELRAAALSPSALEFCRTFARGVRAAAEGPLRRRLEEKCGARAGDPSGALVWATSAVQSRTFVLSLPGVGREERVRRVLPPGIDFANHDSLSPTAEARVRHSPGAVQGRDAVEEVVDPRFSGNGGGESVIELVAGAEGIRLAPPPIFSPVLFRFFSVSLFIFSHPLLPSFLSHFLFTGPAKKSPSPTATTPSTLCSLFTASFPEKKKNLLFLALPPPLLLLPPLPLPPPLLSRGGKPWLRPCSSTRCRTSWLPQRQWRSASAFR